MIFHFYDTKLRLRYCMSVPPASVILGLSKAKVRPSYKMGSEFFSFFLPLFLLRLNFSVLGEL
jgi:hypothetical protein